MAHGKFLSVYEVIKNEIESLLYKLEHNIVTVLDSSTPDFHNIIFDIENMTEDDYQELYPDDNPESIQNEYERLLKDFKHLLDRYLECAYREGEWNIVCSGTYEYKNQIVPTLELLKLLPKDFYLKEHIPEDNYHFATENPYSEHEAKLCLFVSARAGYEPAIKLAKEKYGWDLDNN